MQVIKYKCSYCLNEFYTGELKEEESSCPNCGKKGTIKSDGKGWAWDVELRETPKSEKKILCLKVLNLFVKLDLIKKAGNKEEEKRMEAEIDEHLEQCEDCRKFMMRFAK